MYIYGILIFFTAYGLFHLLKFLLKNFKKFKIKYFYSEYSILIYLLFFLLCISPPTDIDSIDYHLGAPATWYEYKSFYSRKDWLHYRFTGLGEYINIIGIYLKTFNFGQLIQFFSLILVGLFGYKHIENSANKKYFILAVLSCPLLLFLISTQKYHLTSASIIFCSIIFILHNSKFSNLDIICLVGSLIFAVGSKFSYIIPCGLIWFYLAYKCYNFGNIKNLIIYSLISFIFILIIPLYLKNYFFYGDPLSPILEIFKNNSGSNTGINELLLSGTEALVRATLIQKERDDFLGFSTAGYVTGYRGSPLGSVDQEFNRTKKLLKEKSIFFRYKSR